MQFGNTMSRREALAACAIAPWAMDRIGGVSTTTLTGAGASFPAPLYSQWFRKYSESNRDIVVNYQSIGSGAGVAQFSQRIVDFGASDAAMTDREMEKLDFSVKLLPMTAGGIVLTFNLPGIEKLRLTAEVIAGIAGGSIARWDAKEIREHNPGVDLPGLPITWVHRSDGSGTTYVFSGWLAANNDRFASTIGQGKQLDWTGVRAVGGRGNAGITAIVGQTPGACGYIEFGYAVKSSRKLAIAEILNAAGEFVTPSVDSCKASLQNFRLPPNLRAFDFRPQGAASYPIVTLTWILAYGTYPGDTAEKMKNLLTWCLGPGQAESASLGYVPLPKNMVATIMEAVDSITAERRSR